jgi:hypothetical protein
VFSNDEPPENALPPEKVHFIDVHVEPWPDGRRVRVHASITPFRKRPNLEATIETMDGDLVASASIIETMTPRLVFTLHIRRPDPSGRYTLKALLVYPEKEPVDQVVITFEIKPAQENF